MPRYLKQLECRFLIITAPQYLLLLSNSAQLLAVFTVAPLSNSITVPRSITAERITVAVTVEHNVLHIHIDVSSLL